MICARNGQRLLSDAVLADKADLILMAPVESLLIMVAHHLQMPDAGLPGPNCEPVKSTKDAQEKSLYRVSPQG